MNFDVLTIIVFLNVIATIALWREAARKPPKPEKRFIAALLHGDPIEPEHQPPNPEKWLSLMTEQDRIFFDDFADFASVVNWWLADDLVSSSWRLQELPDNELSLAGISDGPDFGRCYAIFHNQVRLGRLEISPGAFYGVEERHLRTRFKLSSIRLLPLAAVYEFLTTIELHVSNQDADSKEYFKTTMANVSAITDVIWKTQQISEFDKDEGWGELELQLDGSASWYFVRREGLSKERAA